MTDLEKRFSDEIFETVRECMKIGYTPHYFLQMLSKLGNNGVRVAKLLILKNEVSEGYKKLYDLKRLDLSVEAHAIKKEFKDLFTENEIEICKSRLKDYGYPIPIENTHDPLNQEIYYCLSTIELINYLMRQKCVKIRDIAKSSILNDYFKKDDNPLPVTVFVVVMKELSQNLGSEDVSEILKAFLKAGADVTLFGNRGIYDNLLWWFAHPKSGAFNITNILLLLDAGANPNVLYDITDRKGYTESTTILDEISKPDNMSDEDWEDFYYLLIEKYNAKTYENYLDDYTDMFEKEEYDKD